MSTDDKVQLVFSGALTGEFNLDTAKIKFQKLFHVSTKQIDKLFSGKDIVIKSDISESEAMNFAIKISDTGCECSIEAIRDENDISNQAGFVEQRKGERRVRVRRPPRPGAIVPDRRILVGRRKGDSDNINQLVG